MNLITAGVAEGLIGASANMKIANVSMGQYRQAKSRGDTGAMQSSLEYASKSTDRAKAYTKESQQALEAAKEEATRQARAEQQADLQKSAFEAARERRQNTAAARQIQQAVADGGPAVAVEGGNEVTAAAPVADTQAEVVLDTLPDVDIPGGTKIYTASGGIKSPAAKPKVSVSV